jgi:hypothetical protein
MKISNCKNSSFNFQYMSELRLHQRSDKLHFAKICAKLKERLSVTVLANINNPILYLSND